MEVNGSHACLDSRESVSPVATDATLVRRAREGDAAAREELARTSGDAAFRFALQLLGDRELARDVAQDSVLRLFSSLRRVDPERPFQPFLFSIVHNRIIDLRRRAHSRGERGSAPASQAAGGDAGERPLDSPDAEPGPLERSERSELQRLMWSCLGRLDRAHREILVLRDYQDLSYREIAEVLAVPLGTVMSRLHAARRRLRAEVLATGYRFGGGS
jgi:RNA polymerase sigma-70 factor (ECF subfamily)